MTKLKKRKVFTIDVGKMPRKKVEEIIKDLKRKMTKINDKPIEPKWR